MKKYRIIEKTDYLGKKSYTPQRRFNFDGVYLDYFVVCFLLPLVVFYFFAFFLKFTSFCTYRKAQNMPYIVDFDSKFDSYEEAFIEIEKAKRIDFVRSLHNNLCKRRKKTSEEIVFETC